MIIAQTLAHFRLQIAITFITRILILYEEFQGTEKFMP